MASDDTMARTGRCVCGGVDYRLHGPMRPVVNCHCERCRRITGHFMAATGCARRHLELRADATLCWYEAAAGVFYGFCGTCGSTVFWRSDDSPGWISVTAGTLDPPTGLHTQEAWWTDEAADYHVLDQTITNYAHEPGHAGFDAGG